MTYCPRRTQADRKPLLGKATHSEHRPSRKPTEVRKAAAGRQGVRTSGSKSP